MKKILLFIPTIIYPYSLVFFFFSTLGIIKLKTNGFFDLLIIFIPIPIYLLAFICILIILIFKRKKMSSYEIVKMNMIVKLLHIPTYLILLFYGLCFMLTIFTIAASFIIIILDILTILLSGSIGLAAVINTRKEKRIDSSQTILYIMLQYTYCVDVISSIILYKKVKRQIIHNNERSTSCDFLADLTQI